MTRVFLSYAEEDAGVARRVAERLRASGAEVFRWEDPEHRAERFIERIQAEIEKADVFVALISPVALGSTWCGREREIAFHRETQLKRQFVYVFEVAPTKFDGTGLLRTYAWVDLKEPVDEQKLARALAVLERERPAPAEGGTNGTPPNVFRNRTDELTRIRTTLGTTGTDDFWLVVSPPRMGKSWFLHRLLWELKEGDWRARLIDLRNLTSDHRADWAKVLCQLLDVAEPDGAFTEEDRYRAAAVVSNRSCRQLFLLDSAELLEQPAAHRLRRELTEIYKLVGDSGNEQTRMSVVVGTRRQDEWQGFRSSGGSSVLFQVLPLTEFTVSVVRQALHEFKRTFGSDRLNRWAEGLHQLSEGLPALLVKGLRWAEETAFTRLTDCETGNPAVFDTVARPYISEDLLAADSLLPFGGEQLSARKKALELTLRAIVPYRIFTQSHLRHHIEHDVELADALHAAGWDETGLWEAMSRTALLASPSEELWQVLNPPIRRLLYRYYHPDTPARRRVHVSAREFYEKWAVTPAGVEQGVVLIECLWHEATKLRLEEHRDLRPKLLAATVELSAAFGRPERFGPAEFSRYVTQKLGADGEFAALLRSEEGLFDDVVHTLGETISGGG
ncbi:TIR domain-containing protein [Amycolatopsis sp. NPDC021455]|uniref:TIR domain-containing protein n=1 Tax=Amycolatopsis sp. NPDC021455 TaxID=3154901 RepID=UPI0033FEB114